MTTNADLTPRQVKNLISRMNRRLRLDDELVRVPRSERMRLTVGNYYLYNFNRNYIARYIPDDNALRELAQEIGCELRGL